MRTGAPVHEIPLLLEAFSPRAIGKHRIGRLPGARKVRNKYERRNGRVA